ncbi:hypothetical protein [Streptomyces sp. 196(2019)]|uniref:hypothetical protein n=1 Tax=Streptomyces sp. 196(2019) TaxID=2683820 RepID=UPI0013EB2777|nr:hypothetical protein [Streptomyces sp. 196(2019)]NGO86899.1 hypothetical protein [Streptomyces sp. 196(2019)]
MPGTFKWLKQEFLIEGAWDGIDLDGPVRHLKAGIGAGRSSLADACWVTLGAVSLKLLPAVTERVQASRVTVEFDNGIWIITHDLTTRGVVFLNIASGEVQEFAVFPEGGERSAGSYTVELMGIPVVETARGSVTLDSVMSLLYLQQIHASRTVYGGANANDLAVTFEVVFGLLDEKAAKLKAQSRPPSVKPRKPARPWRRPSGSVWPTACRSPSTWTPRRPAWPRRPTRPTPRYCASRPNSTLTSPPERRKQPVRCRRPATPAWRQTGHSRPSLRSTKPAVRPEPPTPRKKPRPAPTAPNAPSRCGSAPARAVLAAGHRPG